jgi:hypothetical protein
VDLPETVNIDENSEIIADIANGSFLTCICPTCNAELHTDLRTRLDWPSKKRTIELIPEIDRLSFLSGAIAVPGATDIVIGYPELADRIAVLASDLNPLVIEAVKYHLAVKARDTNPDVKPVILFEKKNDAGDLEFHIHGLKKDEVAITIIPRRIYDAIEKDAKDSPEAELFVSLANGAYVSVQNILIEDSAQ